MNVIYISIDSYIFVLLQSFRLIGVVSGEMQFEGHKFSLLQSYRIHFQQYPY